MNGLYRRGLSRRNPAVKASIFPRTWLDTFWTAPGDEADKYVLNDTESWRMLALFT